MLKQEYKENETSLSEALDLAIKVLSKTLDMTKLTPEKIELATLTRENDKTQIKILPADQVKLAWLSFYTSTIIMFRLKS